MNKLVIALIIGLLLGGLLGGILSPVIRAGDVIRKIDYEEEIYKLLKNVGRYDYEIYSLLGEIQEDVKGIEKNTR